MKGCRQIDGVFALIIYDSNRKKLFASRDPYGVRPLFIGYNELDELFFSFLRYFCVGTSN